MAIGQIPPWLNVQPSDFLQAQQQGTAAGISVAELRQRAAQQAAAIREAQARRAQEAWEAGERMRFAAQQAAENRAMEQEKAAALAEYRRGQLAQQAAELAQRRDYQTGTLDLREQQAKEAMARQAEMMALRGSNLELSQKRLEETGRHNMEMEAARKAAQEGKITPLEYQTITEKLEAVDPVEGSPGSPAEVRGDPIFGIDWLWPDKAAVPAIEAVPGRGETTITRRVPLDMPQMGTNAPSLEIPTAPPASERVVGRQYRTPKGIYTWTGQGWTQ